MDVSLIADTAAVAATQALGFANSIIHCNNSNFLHLSAVILDAIAPPAVKSSSLTTVRRNRHRRRRRTRRKTYGGGESDDRSDAGEELGFYGGDGGGAIGRGGGSWGSGGRGGWNFGQFGGQNWEESSWFGSAEFAYGFVYEVIYWIALSTCLHFALGRVVRMMSGGIGDGERGKGSMRWFLFVDLEDSELVHGILELGNLLSQLV